MRATSITRSDRLPTQVSKTWRLEYFWPAPDPACPHCLQSPTATYAGKVACTRCNWISPVFQYWRPKSSDQPLTLPPLSTPLGFWLESVK